ncbi:hypothetical protein B0H19DRAFT_1128806 [Mycena capillaripes]|nr:hypothetical protein B0H19DRAFT_1128806 [Mycena capillaripes]
MNVGPPAESTARRATRGKKRKAESNPSDGSAPKRAKPGKKGRLQGLLAISLDVVFEIFGFLQPLDVLRLSRISKEFRSLLMHKSSISIWRSSLRNVVPELPPCPPSMTEPQWISLVFDATCQVCQKIARKVDWGLFIRICGKCAKTHLGSRIHGIEMDGKDPVNFTTLIPNRRDPSRPFQQVFFSQALENIKTAYNALTDPEEKQKFVEERKEIVKDLAERSKLCAVWAESVADNRSTELADLKEERYAAIVAKLTALGWGSEIDSILPSDSLRSHKAVKQPTILTARTWKTIEPEMIQYMERMKAKRLVREHAALVVVRKGIATKVLRTFKRSQLPWIDIMPGAPDFCDFPEIKDILTQPAAVDVDEQTFEALLPDFPGMIATWRQGLVDQMVKVYKRSNKETTMDDDAIKTHLKLATTVFKCSECDESSFDDWIFFGSRLENQRRCRPLFYPNVLSHRCLSRMADMSMGIAFLFDIVRDVPWRASPLSIDPRTTEIVEKIVVACGMDPATTTVEDMDAADVRLACHACADREEAAPSDGGADASTSAASAAGEKQPTTARAYSWRNAVRHHGELHWRKPTAWYKLEDADVTAARVVEGVLIQKSKEEDRERVRRDMAGDDDLMSNEGEAESVAQEADNSTGEKVPDAENTNEGMQDTGMEAASEGVRVLPSQLPEVAWSCSHCLDMPREPAPMTLESVLKHLSLRHDILSPATLNEDYYRSLAAPEIYSAEYFPAPVLPVLMPPSPPLPAPASRSLTFFDMEGLMYDSDDEEAFGMIW